jgi:Putative adhesin
MPKSEVKTTMNLLPFARGRMGKLAGIGTLALAAMAFTARGAQAEEWTKSYTVSGRAHVRVDSNDGAVRVTTGDNKQVELRVTYSGYTLDKNLTITSRQDGDQVELSARVRNSMNWGWGGIHRSLRLEVHMPREADLNVDTGDGSVEAQALTGNLNIHTGDGHIRVDGAKGDIRLRTGDGSIEGRDLDGRLDANTGDGHVTVEGRFDSLNIKTGDGSITARAGAGSKLASGWTIHTGDGSVDMSIPGDLQANIEASTNDGRISLGIPVTVEGTFSTSKISGKMNGGGQPLTIHTGDGSIHLSKT